MCISSEKLKTELNFFNYRGCNVSEVCSHLAHCVRWRMRVPAEIMKTKRITKTVEKERCMISEEIFLEPLCMFQQI